MTVECSGSANGQAMCVLHYPQFPYNDVSIYHCTVYWYHYASVCVLTMRVPAVDVADVIALAFIFDVRILTDTAHFGTLTACLARM